MPKGPAWHTTTITLDEAPDEPQTFYYRDPVELAAFLIGNPTFKDSLVFEPREWYLREEMLEDDRVFGDVWTGDGWNDLQVSAIDIFFTTLM